MLLPRSALRDWFGAFGTNVALLAIGIVTGVVAARALGPDGRGEFAAILFWGNFVAQLGALGLPSAVTVEAARHGAHQRLLATILLLSALYSLLAVSLFGIAVAVGATAPSPVLVAFIAAYVPVNILGLSLLSVDAGTQRFGLLNAMRIIPQCIYVIAILFLVATGLASAATFAWAMLVGSALVPVARAATAGRAMIRRPDALASRRLIIGGFQFYVPSLIGIAREAGDKLIILAVLDETALGLYAVALTLAGSAIQNVAGATTTILLPKTLATADERVRGHQLATATSASIFVAALMNLAIAALSPFIIPALFGIEFDAAVPVAMALCLAQTARSGTEILSSGLRGFDDWKAMPLSGVIALVVFLPVGYWGARAYGPTGVAMALAVSNAAALAFVLHRAVRRTKLNFGDFIVPPSWMFSVKAVRAKLRKA